MKRILIIGHLGQLGSALMKEPLPESWERLGVDKSECDILNPEQVKQVISEFKPTHVINCAAWVDAPAAETNEEACWALNVTAVRDLVHICEEYESELIQISSDFVFSGKQGFIEENEDAEAEAINVYGHSKALSEYWTLSCWKNKVVRISGLFGETSNTTKGTFIFNVLIKMSRGENVYIYNHHLFSPTYAPHAAHGIFTLISDNYPGDIYHLANDGHASWYEFTKEAVKYRPDLTARLHRRPESEEVNEPVKRPRFSNLINTRGPKMPHWSDGVEEYMASFETPYNFQYLDNYGPTVYISPKSKQRGTDTILSIGTTMETEDYFNKTEKIIDFYKNHWQVPWDMVILDDCSPFEKIDYIVKKFDIPVISFRTKFARLNTNDYLYIWRNYYYLQEMLKNYRKVIHLDNDFFIISKRFMDYVTAFDHGFMTPTCDYNRAPETACQIVTADCHEYLDFVKSGNFAERNGVIQHEFAIPVTHLPKQFSGDRYGEKMSINDYPNWQSLDYWAQAKVGDTIEANK